MNQEIKRRLDKWVEQEYNWLMGQVKKNIAKDQMRDYAEDLLHHVIMDLYKMKDEKLKGLLDNGKLKWYVLSGCGIQIRSQTSPFYSKFRKFKMNARSGAEYLFDLPEEFENEEWYQCFLREWNNLHFYPRTLLEKKFIQGLSYDEIRHTYGISKTHLIKDINQALFDLREKCDCNDDE